MKVDKNILDKPLCNLAISNLSVSFADVEVLKNISINFQKNKVNCIIGPSGSGKSTLLRSLNRINADAHKIRTSGTIYYNNKNILQKGQDVINLRKNIGMVFQTPCVFPKSISENVTFGVQQHKKLSKAEKAIIVEENLKKVSLWPEVHTRLDEPANTLSIGQQQRLCLARTLAIQPKVILMDEPTSSLDPLSTRAIENLMIKLKDIYTVILVTHDISQAKRVSDNVFFICKGELIEEGLKDIFFNTPQKLETKEYLKDEACIC